MDDRSVKIATENAGTIGIQTSKKRWIIAITLMLLVITGYLDRISVAVLFTNTDFQNAMGIGFDPARLGMLMTAFFVTYGISSLLFSFTGDRFGPRNMLILGSSIWGVLMFLMGSAGSYFSMLFSRILLGLFEGPQFSWICKIIAGWFPAKEQGRANSIWLLGSPLGSAIGFPVMIFLVANYGWRNTFYTLGFLSIFIMAPLIFLIVKEVENSPRNSASEPQPKASLRAIWRDSATFLRNRDFWFLTVYDCGTLTYLWGLNSWLPTYLQRSRHFDVQHLGIYSSLPFVLLFMGEVLSGILADRLKYKGWLLLLGLSCASLLIYAATLVSSPVGAALLIAMSSGFFGLCVPATYVVLGTILPPTVVSSGVGVMNGIANTIGALAPLAMGLVIAQTKSVDAGLYVLVAASLLCSFAIIPLLKRH